MRSSTASFRLESCRCTAALIVDKAIGQSSRLRFSYRMKVQFFVAPSSLYSANKPIFHRTATALARYRRLVVIKRVEVVGISAGAAQRPAMIGENGAETIPDFGDSGAGKSPMNLADLIAEHGDWIYAIAFVWAFFEGETFVLFGGL